MKLYLKSIALTSLFWSLLGWTACTNPEAAPSTESAQPMETASRPNVPEWHKNAVIYEVNIRQYTPEGTLAAFEQEVPRLKEMGVDILWLMPIFPISETKRKMEPGDLGSYYSISSYTEINPDMGTMEDFDRLLATIHENGMYCILDWVPNHTGWDHSWITEHPEYYTKDAVGNITDPINTETGEPWGWDDVADLDYDNQEMRLAMIDAYLFWLDKGIDGFRNDVAHSVPVDFWEQSTKTLYEKHGLFFLAEAEKPVLLNEGYFIMDYGWEMHHLFNQIAAFQGASRIDAPQLVQGNIQEEEEEEEPIVKKTALDIDLVLAKKASDYTQGYHMYFTSNHDENSWAGTEFERMGDSHKAFAVLSATFDGMPLIYSGQESAFNRRLAFFTKDSIEWGNYEYATFYQTLFDLKHRNQAIWNGIHGGSIVKIPTNDDESVYAFLREKNGDRVVVIINLTAEDQEIRLDGEGYGGGYNNIFSNASMDLDEGMTLMMGPWDYLVLSSN